LGWFHSVPEKSQQSRAEKIEANGGRPLMPDILGAEYLVGYWVAAGRCSAGAMGPVPLSASEIVSWQRGTRTELLPFEFSTILEMSRGYVEMLHAGEKPSCNPPFGDPVREFDRETVSKKVSNAFRALLQSRKK
jgi:hypothetical protein